MLGGHCGWHYKQYAWHYNELQRLSLKRKENPPETEV
jgi:hypothetical protein